MRFDSEAQKKSLLDLFSLVSLPGGAPSDVLMEFATLKRDVEVAEVAPADVYSEPVRAMETPADHPPPV